MRARIVSRLLNAVFGAERRHVRVMAIIALVTSSVMCGGSKSPASPSPNTPTTPVVTPAVKKATVTVTLVTVQGAKTSAGYDYTVTVKVQESNGVAFTVSSIDLA